MKKKLICAAALLLCVCTLIGASAVAALGSVSGETDSFANPFGNVWYWNGEEAYGQLDGYGTNEQDIVFSADLCLLPDSDDLSTANFMTDGGGGFVITKLGAKINTKSVSYNWGTPSWDNWHRIIITIFNGKGTLSIDGEEIVSLGRGVKAYTEYQLLFSQKGSMAIDNVSLKKADGTVYFSCDYENATQAQELMGTGLGSLKSYDSNELEGVSWKYLDTNTDPAQGLDSRDAWTRADFDDSGWKTAAGSFGALNGEIADMGDGNIPDNLLAQYIPGTAKSAPSYFFRTEIEIEDPDFIFEIDGSILYDDSAAVYINGVKIASFDEPDGGFESNMSYGGSGAAAPKIGVIASTEVSALHAGTNVIAVELHQKSEDSNNIFMNFLNLCFDTSPCQTSILLTPGTDKSQLNFTWYSSSSENGVLRYAKASELVGGKLPQTAESVNSTVGQANLEGFWYNKATASELEAGTEYCYQLSNGLRKTEVYSFSTSTDGDFSFLYVGDPQIGAGGSLTSDGTGWTNSLRVMTENFSDAAFVLSGGDQVNSADDEEQYSAYIDNDYMKSVINPTIVGNHDSGSDSYSQHFNLANESTEYGRTDAAGDAWFTYNGVLFLQLNDNNMSTAQHSAFMKDAIGANADARWIVAVMHHSIYSVANHALESDILQRRSDLAPLFRELGVDVVLMGHDHVYCRSYMIDGVDPITDPSAYDDDSFSSVTDTDGVLYLTANSGSGSKYYDIKNITFPYAAVKNQEYTPTFSAIDVTDGSFSIVTYRVNDMSVMDSFTINRTLPPKEADYTAVEAAKACIPADLSLYTEDSVQRLTDALSAVVTGKIEDEQPAVDAYARDIISAVEALKYKSADYSKLEAAIAGVPDVLDGYEQDGVDRLNAALDAVVRELDITRQSTVDAYADEINEAVNALVKKADEIPDKKPADTDTTEIIGGTVNPQEKPPVAESKPTSPQTGDVNVVMLAVLLFVCAASLTGAVLFRMKTVIFRRSAKSINGTRRAH